MSARLTLLVFCDQSELHSPFISALVSANFQPLVAHHAEQAKKLLSSVAADAIMILRNEPPDNTGVGAELKALAPRTPVILFDNDVASTTPPLGIDSVCHANLQDESVAHAVAIFFRQCLTLSRRQKGLTLRGSSMGFPMSAGPRVAM